MKTLPDDVVAYRETLEFTETSLPEALRNRHSTKRGVWGLIRVSEGSLLYTVYGSSTQDVVLGPATPGVIEPEVEHSVEPIGSVRFSVQFLRSSPHGAA